MNQRAGGGDGGRSLDEIVQGDAIVRNAGRKATLALAIVPS
jgi:hypothetical protein